MSVLALEHDMISTLTLFAEPAGPQLFHAFGVPLTLGAPQAPDCCPRRATPKPSFLASAAVLPIVLECLPAPLPELRHVTPATMPKFAQEPKPMVRS
ncbi:MAG: hypothetical protein ACLPX9_01005 [Rhodomicrobium sp.]